MNEFQPPDPIEDREAMAEAQWESLLTAAYGEGRKDEREDLVRLLGWAYSKLHHVSFTKMEDALALDEIKLVLMGVA